MSISMPSGVDKGRETDTCSSSERREVVEQLGPIIGGGEDEPSDSITIRSLFGLLTM